MSEQNPANQAPKPPQQSFGSAPAGSESFGSAPAGSESFGAAPPPAAPPAAPQPIEPMPKKKSKVPAIVLSVVAVAVLAAVLLGGFLLTRDSAVNAEVGSCFDNSLLNTTLTDASKLKTVDCDSAEAMFRVVGIVENKKQQEALDLKVCSAFPSATGGVWIGDVGEAGKVFCTEEIEK